MRAEARRRVIREILAQRRVPTQEALRRELRARRIKAAQATLSRDLAHLGVRRVVGPLGARYEIRGDDGSLPIDPVRVLVDSVESNGALVVVRARAGAASTVARAIDEARVPGVLGSLAGDDTIFLAPTSARGGGRLARRVRKLFGLGAS